MGKYLSPGKELDIEVATKVMGWKRMSYKDVNPGNKYYEDRTELTGYWHDADGKEMERAEDCDDYYSPQEAWSPSTNIAEAWTVMERLAHFNCCLELLGDYNYRWRVRLTMGYPREGDHKPYASVECDTAPHAICLTALKAIEHKNSLTNPT